MSLLLVSGLFGSAAVVYVTVEMWQYRTGRRCHVCDRRRPCDRSALVGWVCQDCRVLFKIEVNRVDGGGS